jgi:lysozyme family protein
MRYSEIWPRYAKYWDTMQIKPGWVRTFNNEAKFALDHKVRYVEVELVTKVPWEMIACIHRRESDADFDTYLGNGQALDQRTTEVPVGRGPFPSFLAGAIDAIKVEGWGSIIDWRIEKMLYYMLLFNGTGSEAWGHPSSYIWGGTNIQQPGKWIRDHVWSSSVMDPQPGCAPLLYSIAQMDPTVKLVRED